MKTLNHLVPVPTPQDRWDQEKSNNMDSRKSVIARQNKAPPFQSFILEIGYCSLPSNPMQANQIQNYYPELRRPM